MRLSLWESGDVRESMGDRDRVGDDVQSKARPSRSRSNPKPLVVSDVALSRLPGGDRIAFARRQSRALLREPWRGEDAAAGARGGWDGLRRRGDFQHLLPSEHFYDEDEFLRRAVDGEQLHLARQCAPGERGLAVLLWDLIPASLGLPRLHTIGLALALSERWCAAGAPILVSVSGAQPVAIDDELSLVAMIERPPRTRALTRVEWREALHRAVGDRCPEIILHAGSGRDASDAWIRPDELELARGTTLGFVVGRSAIESFAWSQSSRHGEWTRRGHVGLPLRPGSRAVESRAKDRPIGGRGGTA